MCKLEKETVHHLVECNVNMSIENFWKVYGNDSGDTELVAVAVGESVNTRNRFIWISNTYVIILDVVYRLTWIRISGEA